MKFTPASPAIALASSVLPTPGPPSIRMPRGARAPSAAKRAGWCRNRTTSDSADLASPAPTTDENETPVGFSTSFASEATSRRIR